MMWYIDPQGKWEFTRMMVTSKSNPKTEFWDNMIIGQEHQYIIRCSNNSPLAKALAELFDPLAKEAGWRPEIHQQKHIESGFNKALEKLSDDVVEEGMLAEQIASLEQGDDTTLVEGLMEEIRFYSAQLAPFLELRDALRKVKQEKWWD